MNNRKIIDISSRHNSRAEVAQHRMIEGMAPTSKNTTLKKVPVDFLRDNCAVQQYKRLAKILSKSGLIGNADKDNLIAYCNAWSVYIETQKAMDDPGSRFDDPEIEGKRQDRLFRKNTQALKTMSTFGNKLGMSVSARLQKGAAIVKQKQEEVEERFGAI